jgi:hypothetical protein
MKSFRRYVILGTADKHIERAFVYLEWVTVAVLIFAAVVFAPVVFDILVGKLDYFTVAGLGAGIITGVIIINILFGR